MLGIVSRNAELSAPAVTFLSHHHAQLGNCPHVSYIIYDQLIDKANLFRKSFLHFLKPLQILSAFLACKNLRMLQRENHYRTQLRLL